MMLRLEIQHETSQGYEPMQIKNERVVFSMLMPIRVIHNLTIYSPMPRTPAGMKQGDQSNKLIVLNVVYFMALRVQNAGCLGIVRVLLDILRYQKNNCT